MPYNRCDSRDADWGAGTVVLSRLLLLLTFDEDRFDPLLSDKGVASVRSFCSLHEGLDFI